MLGYQYQIHFTAEAFGKMGWDSITIDMQHGQNDYQTSIAMLQAFQVVNLYQWFVYPGMSLA